MSYSKPIENLHGVVIGLGSIGNRHLNNLLSLGVGSMTVVRRANSQNTQFQPPENVKICHSLSEALSNQPDFAVICNPTHLHASTAADCLEAGLHVLIEKPLGRVIGESENRLAAMAKESQSVCAMAYCMRYHPAYQLAKQRIEAGAIGDCRYAKAWFEGYLPDWHPWEDYRESYAALRKQGGGVLRTLDHELDFMNWVLGAAHAVTGKAFNTGAIGIEADDLAIYSLEHSSGAISQVTTSFVRKPQSRGFEFVGASGTISFRFEEGKVVHRPSDGGAENLLLDVDGYDINQMYLSLAEDFLEAVQTGSSASLPILQNGIDCMKVFELLETEQ